LVNGKPECTLRTAIQEANAAASKTIIKFNIPGGGVPRISPATPLPTIVKSVNILADTQPGLGRVELDGSALGQVTGLHLTGGNSTVRGFALFNFGSHGILITEEGRNTIASNIIGTDTNNTPDIGNGGDGVRIENTSDNQIGGSTGNTISGNLGNGVTVTGSGATDTTIAGNFIGTDNTGACVGEAIDCALGNKVHGIEVSGGAFLVDIHFNVISGSGQDGIRIEGTEQELSGDTTIRDNIIGTDREVLGQIANKGNGILILNSLRNRITDNWVSGNLGNGIKVSGNLSATNSIEGNFIGLSGDPLKIISNSGDGVELADGAHDNTIGGITSKPGTGLGNVVSGNLASGIRLDGENTNNNLVAGNLIGTSSSGLRVPNTDFGNRDNGVTILNSPFNTIGSVDGGRNVISNNVQSGIKIEGEKAINSTIISNYVGTDIEGTGQLLGNGRDGIEILNVSETLIGGEEPGKGNIISNNKQHGISIFGPDARTNLIYGNFIGTDKLGEISLRNQGNGIHLENTANNNIGGDTVGHRNVINYASISSSSANNSGIEIKGVQATGNKISGNYIGINRAGTTAFIDTFEPLQPNNWGIHINGAPGNIIGGKTSMPGYPPGNPHSFIKKYP
jgi:hypothetical protein